MLRPSAESRISAARPHLAILPHPKLTVQSVYENTGETEREPWGSLAAASIAPRRVTRSAHSSPLPEPLGAHPAATPARWAKSRCGHFFSRGPAVQSSRWLIARCASPRACWSAAATGSGAYCSSAPGNMVSIFSSDYFEVKKKGGLSQFQTMMAYLGGSALQTVGDNPVTAYRQLVQQYAKDLKGELTLPNAPRPDHLTSSRRQRCRPEDSFPGGESCVPGQPRQRVAVGAGTAHGWGRFQACPQVRHPARVQLRCGRRGYSWCDLGNRGLVSSQHPGATG